jgi:hypothetical protein
MSTSRDEMTILVADLCAKTMGFVCTLWPFMRHGDPSIAGQHIEEHGSIRFVLRMKWAFLLLFWGNNWGTKICNM